MRLFFMDYESFWSQTHSLTKMNPVQYIMHRDTEIQSLAYAWDDGPVQVIFGEQEIGRFLQAQDFSNAMIVCHNGIGFDHLISSWRFGINPKAWACTLSMARPLYGLTHRLSLDSLASLLNVGQKGSLEATNTKGKRLKDFSPSELEAMRIYNKQDVVLLRAIFHALIGQLPKGEMQLIDASIRLSTELKFQADTALLQQALNEEIARKQVSLIALAMQCGVYQPGMSAEQAASAMRPIVMSQPQFAQLLTGLGAIVPMKDSPPSKVDGSVKKIPALAKTDQGLADLLDDPDPLVAMAAATRLEIKSTQLETRLRTFLDVADSLNGYLPFPINYCGATITWRMSGSMKMNCQNMPRVDEKAPKPADALRQSWRAPDGHLIVVCDSSNIEMRVAHALAGSDEVVTRLRAGEDMYCWFASHLYQRPITKADKDERFIGKVAMLSLQYGASWVSFQNMVRVLSQGQTLLDEATCRSVVSLWRELFPALAGRDGIWKRCEQALSAMASGQRMEIDGLGLCVTDQERIWTPGGHWLSYPDLRRETNNDGKQEWRYGHGRHASRIYGSHLLENMCQHLARLIVMEQTQRVNRTFKGQFALTAHDEGGWVVPQERAEECKALALQSFSTPPSWWRTLPLAAEAGIGVTYSDAK